MKIYPFCPETKILDKHKYNENVKKIKTKTYTKAKKVLCEWTNKKQ